MDTSSQTSETHWIVEGNIDPRWPHNTRGNIGEVFPEVLTPLSYELGVIPAERAWRDAYRKLGILQDGDFASHDPVIIGLYGGYAYLNLSYLRMMGVRAPGSSAEAIDVAFFGEGDPPPYVAQKGDKSLRGSLGILKTVLGALGTKALPPVVADSYSAVRAWEAKRPALDAPDKELLAYMYALPESFEQPFGNHMESTAVAAIVSGVLADACAAAGEPGLVTHLVGASGSVVSAQYSRDLWTIAKMVRSSPKLVELFDGGVDGLLARADDLSEAKDFLRVFANFTAEHGHRGPNDWELSSRTWDNTPELALVAIDRMRVAETDLAPETRLGDDEAKREAAIERVRPHLNFLDKMNFDKAIKAVPFWSQAREATRDRAVRHTMPAKQVYRELVRRAAERGGDPDPTRVAMLKPATEFRQYMENPAEFMDIIAERSALRDRFAAVTPPFFISNQGDVLSIEGLESQQVQAIAGAATGDTLTGSAGCSGVARGRARVVMDPAEATDLEPGEVLVAPLTDPSWTPLFMPAAAVVVNVGALMSHAVIVSRELGIPCVVAVENATDRIATGMMVEVDGTAGTVTILE